MKSQFAGIALAAMLVVGTSLAGHTEDAVKPADTAAPAAAVPAATKADAPASVPRPSLAPKTAEPASSPAATEAPPRRHRRYARHHYQRYAYWEPFPVYLPHVHRHRVYWNRIPWFYF
ncbi:MAG: hypothetical protein ABJA75_21505 [Bradyrhizobium sp.]